MARRVAFALLALAASLGAAQPASAAWKGPGTCRVPAAQERYYEQLDTANNRFSTRKVPCWMAANAIMGMIDDGRWSRPTFRYTATGARWQLKLSCRSRVDEGSDAPQPGRIIRCRVRKGVDGETDRSTTRNLRGGRIRWKTAYTG